MKPKCSLNMRTWTHLTLNVDEAVHYEKLGSD
jgi:hypothetical protein